MPPTPTAIAPTVPLPMGTIRFMLAGMRLHHQFQIPFDISPFATYNTKRCPRRQHVWVDTEVANRGRL